jgi:16S rRNA (cytosine1402-N4)-methyltransferase
VGDAAASHRPVLVAEVTRALVPALEREGSGVLVDATAGLGGHTAAIVAQARPKLVVLLDRDAEALAIARDRLAGAPCPLRFVHAPFSSLAAVLADLGLDAVAAFVADLGVSSLQLDEGARGFSWRADAPLDMRMDRSRGEPAADAIARMDEAELARILRDYGEEPDARRIAGAIASARPRTTAALAEVVSVAMSARERRKLGSRIHPAPRTFQALRIHVNDELGELDRLLGDAPWRLEVGGRFAILTFHSLEDRRVKHRFRELSRADVPARLPVRAADLPAPKFAIPRGYAQGVVAGAGEVASNPRARSARMRVLERVAA